MAACPPHSIVLGTALGRRVWVTSRDEAKREWATVPRRGGGLRASGARLPEQVDAVMETVGEATWGHSLRRCGPVGGS